MMTRREKNRLDDYITKPDDNGVLWYDDEEAQKEMDKAEEIYQKELEEEGKLEADIKASFYAEIGIIKTLTQELKIIDEKLDKLDMSVLPINFEHEADDALGNLSDSAQELSSHIEALITSLTPEIDEFGSDSEH